MAKKQNIKTRTKSRPKQSSGISPVIIGVVVVAALLLVGGLVLLGNQGSESTTTVDLDLTGYPTMGDQNAPVTMIDFSDFG